MRLSQILSTFFVVCGLTIVGCGRSSEPTSLGGSELESYVEENAAEIAAEEAAMEAEDAEEDEDDE